MNSGSPDSPDRATSLARSLWAYFQLGHESRPADAILVLGSNDLRVAEHGAKLWLEGRAPLLVITGGRGRLTRDWQESEAEVFAGEAVRLGVPRDKILLETESTNTGENIRFTRRLVEEQGLDLEGWLLVAKPYLERRGYATFVHFWPGKELTVTSPPIGFDEYPLDGGTPDLLIHRLVGEVYRLLVYPRLGYQAQQDVPPEVLVAYEELLGLGYDRYLVKVTG